MLACRIPDQIEGEQEGQYYVAIPSALTCMLRRLASGYFAADGNAAQTSASSGDKWRAHLAPDKPGKWNYEVAIVAGRDAAMDDDAARSALSILHSSGSFTV